jgi:uncharacterized repeat protein (TIGR03803 family)
VYELTPPTSPGGAWTETLAYSFAGPPADGGVPVGKLVLGENGSLYGASMYGGLYNQGTVFELTPPASFGAAWTLAVLYAFRGDGEGTNPGVGVVIGDNGTIYGTTTRGGPQGYGTLFALEQTDGVWEEKTLASLGGEDATPGGVALGHNGEIYGLTTATIFKAMPPTAAGSSWTVQYLCTFGTTASLQPLTISAAGQIYWTTPGGGRSACGSEDGCGALYELMPPTPPGGTWKLRVLHSFTGKDGDGYQPNPGLVITKSGDVYGTTYYGGKNFFGTVFRYTPDTAAEPRP